MMGYSYSSYYYHHHHPLESSPSRGWADEFPCLFWHHIVPLVTIIINHMMHACDGVVGCHLACNIIQKRRSGTKDLGDEIQAMLC